MHVNDSEFDVGIDRSTHAQIHTQHKMPSNQIQKWPIHARVASIEFRSSFNSFDIIPIFYVHQVMSSTLCQMTARLRWKRNIILCTSTYIINNNRLINYHIVRFHNEFLIESSSINRRTKCGIANDEIYLFRVSVSAKAKQQKILSKTERCLCRFFYSPMYADHPHIQLNATMDTELSKRMRSFHTTLRCERSKHNAKPPSTVSRLRHGCQHLSVAQSNKDKNNEQMNRDEQKNP